MHSWQTQPAVQCLLYAATGARVCLRLLADNEALLIAVMKAFRCGEQAKSSMETLFFRHAAGAIFVR